MTMSDIFDLTNILLLAVAVAIFLRLRSVLGRRTGEEQPPRLDPYAARDAAAPRENNVIPLPGVRPPAPDAKPAGQSVDERVGPLTEGSRALEPLREIAKADPTFDTASFLNGAKIAYEAIVTAYAHGERDILRNLLSREVFESFNSVVAERESAARRTS